MPEYRFEEPSAVILAGETTLSGLFALEPGPGGSAESGTTGE